MNVQITMTQDLLSAKLAAHVKSWADARPTATIAVSTGARARTAEKNALIAHVQAAYHRNPFYFDRAMLKEIKARLRMKAETGRGLYQEIGKIMLDGVRAHAANEQNMRGHFRKLTAAYAAIKARKYGSMPILRATGELINTLNVVIRSGA